ncbi:MAG: MBOAT family protein [Planctomycetaceae bacterium]|nr:MBOAT family protein [Planctomycetaceae bacterium]
MLFSSPIFLFLFLPVVLWLYVVTPRPLKNILLLLASLLFYAWGERAYVLVMLASIAWNYAFGLLVDRFHGRRAAWWVLTASVVGNLALLVAMKYANFIVDNLNPLLTRGGWSSIELSPVHLPIGISFFTFQALSYVVDVYRRDAKAQKNPAGVALYVALFPQLIAGPIVRYRDVASELVRRRMRLKDFSEGVVRFSIGLGKKVLIANTLAAPADQIFAIPASELPTAVAWLGILCYSFQIYFDFSGYSDMAIGLGRMFGFHFARNFNYPYISRSVTEFWRRWHISLSTWFRDYVYIPLGGNRCAAWKVYRNLLIVFLLCGLWHGAAWQFLAWGALHGCFLVVERLGFSRLLAYLPRFVGHAYLLLAVAVGWVFFRAADLGQAVDFLSSMTGFATGDAVVHSVARYLANDVSTALIAATIGSLPILPRALLACRRLERKWRPVAIPLQLARYTGRLAAVASILVASAVQLAAGTYNPFIYFQF